MPCCPSERFRQRIYLSVPHMSGTELRLVEEAFRSNWLSTVGPHLAAFEREFSGLVGMPAVALGSGTAALHLAIKLVGVRPGDEVVLPTLTFAAAANVVRYEQGLPVFIDSQRQTWAMDPLLLADFLSKRAAVNRLPKAVMVVHLYGQSVPLDGLLPLCSRYELPLIEDVANALGTQYHDKQVGAFGAAGIFSLAGNKVITATCGGVLISPRKEWVEKARFWSAQARDPDPLGVNNYMHSELGYNYRMSNVLAGIARGQLPLLEERVAQRRAVFARYRDAFADLPGLEPMPETPCSRHTRWLSCFLIDEKQFGLPAADLIRFLEAANVESRPVWKPMHTQKLYQGFECIGGAVAEDLNRRGICLPSSSCLTGEEQQFVIDRVREAHTLARQRPA
jgi:pyridoxal phosphate-dependent aminotransferase EpsN